MKKLIILTIITAIGFGTMGAKDRKMYRNSDYPTLLTVKNRLAAGFDTLRTQVIKEPQGFIKYPYLIPAGFYSQLWDWDAYFMANHFISKGQPEYMKNWVLTFSQGIDEDGYVAGCMTKDGPDRLIADVLP